MNDVKRVFKGTVFNGAILGSGQVLAFDAYDCVTPIDDLEGQEVWVIVQNFEPGKNDKLLVVEQDREKSCFDCIHYSFCPETRYEPREDYCKATDDDFDECVKKGYKFFERRNVNERRVTRYG